jgi:hypothetical protein
MQKFNTKPNKAKKKQAAGAPRAMIAGEDEKTEMGREKTDSLSESRRQ